jgi:hypothetical protein
MKHLLMAIALCGLVWAGNASAQAPAARAEEDLVQDEAMNLLWWGDFDELERRHASYQQVDQRTGAGRSKLVLFRTGLAQVFDGPDNSKDAYFAQMDALTLAWARAHPRSALAHVLHAQALLAHGWSYRGHGYANTIPPEALSDFKRYTQAALQYAAEHQADMMRSSSGYVMLLEAGRAAGWDLDRFRAVAQAGMALNDDDEGLYRGWLAAALPKWGGSAAEVDRVIQDIAKRTAAKHGDIYYSRMYAWASDWEFHHQVFSDSRASWPRAKAGYEELIKRYPAAVNINGYAHFACLAKDKPQLLALLQRIGEAPVLSVWGTNGARTYETCQRWATAP